MVDLVGQEVKGPRRYDVTRRAEQTLVKRTAVLRSALHLIGSDGYAPTTMAAIARRAEVSVEFVYKQFRDKPELAKQLLGFALTGDETRTPMENRPRIQAVIAEPDARKAIALYAEYVADVNIRAGGLLIALAAAAQLDERLAEVWRASEQGRLSGSARAVGDIAGKAALVVPVETATDITWALNGPELHRLLVRERGWSAVRYIEWLADTLYVSLLGAPLAEPSPRP